MAISSYLLIITLNVNGINAQIKRYSMDNLIKKANLYSAQKTHCRAKDTQRLKVRGWKIIFLENGNDKKEQPLVHTPQCGSRSELKWTGDTCRKQDKVCGRERNWPTILSCSTTFRKRKQKFPAAILVHQNAHKFKVYATRGGKKHGAGVPVCSCRESQGLYIRSNGK